jgi:hypothetical protein
VWHRVAGRPCCMPSALVPKSVVVPPTRVQNPRCNYCNFVQRGQTARVTAPISAQFDGYALRRRDIPTRGAYLLFGGILAVISVVALLPGLIGPSLDAAVFSVVGERVAQGALPYADIFDHKPPALYLLIALVQLLAGSIGTWKVAWLLSVVSVAMTGVVVADTLRQVGWRRMAWLAGGLCVAELASFPLALGGGLSETACVLPAALALRIVAVGPRTPARRLSAGLLAGISTAISLQAIPAAVALIVVAATRTDGASRPWRSRALDALWIAAGTAAVWAGLLFFFGMSDTTLAAFNAIVTYNSAYQRVAYLDDPVAGEALHALLVLGPLALAAALGMVVSLRSSRNRAVEIGALAWLGASLAFVAYQGRLELHYTALFVVPLALLAPAGLTVRLRGGLRTLLPTAITVGLLTSAFILSALLVTAETTLAMGVRSFQVARTDAVAEWVEKNVPEDGSVFVWGNSPELYLDIPRSPASAYVYLLPLTTPGFVDRATVERVRHEFDLKPPSVIIDAGSPAPGAAGLPALLIPRPVAAADGRNADMLDPLRAFVSEHYQHAATVDGWPIYVLR